MLAPWKKNYDQPRQHIKKQRHYFANKDLSSQSYGFSSSGEGTGTPLQYSCLENPMDRGAWWAAVCGVTQSRTRLKWLSSMYGCESWTIKKAEHQRIDAFELWCWRRLLRVPWRARRSNQSILKEISPEYSLEGLMLKLKLQYFGHLMWRIDSFEKTVMLGKIEGGRRRGGEAGNRGWDGLMADSVDMSLSKLRELVVDREAWCPAVYRVAKSWTWLSDWIESFGKTQGLSMLPSKSLEAIKFN